MRVRVFYHSLTGNTRKVAGAIARAVGCVAEPVGTATVDESVGMLFLGASIHAKDIDPSVKKFIEEFDPSLVKHVTVFGTGFEGNKEMAVGIMRDLLATKNPRDEQALFLSGQVPVLQLPPPQRPGPERGREVRAERSRRLTLRASVLEQRYPCGETGRPHGAGPDTGLDLSDVRRVQEQHAQP